MELCLFADGGNFTDSLGHLNTGSVDDEELALTVFFQQKFQGGDVGGTEAIDA